IVAKPNIRPFIMSDIRAIMALPAPIIARAPRSGAANRISRMIRSTLETIRDDMAKTPFAGDWLDDSRTCFVTFYGRHALLQPKADRISGVVHSPSGLALRKKSKHSGSGQRNTTGDCEQQI